MKLELVQLVKTFPVLFFKSKVLFQCSQKPASEMYFNQLKLDRSSQSICLKSVKISSNWYLSAIF
jgi:hypothetical protein